MEDYEELYGHLGIISGFLSSEDSWDSHASGVHGFPVWAVTKTLGSRKYTKQGIKRRARQGVVRAPTFVGDSAHSQGQQPHRQGSPTLVRGSAPS